MAHPGTRCTDSAGVRCAECPEQGAPPENTNTQGMSIWESIIIHRHLTVLWALAHAYNKRSVHAAIIIFTRQHACTVQSNTINCHVLGTWSHSENKFSSTWKEKHTRKKSSLQLLWYMHDSDSMIRAGRITCAERDAFDTFWKQIQQHLLEYVTGNHQDVWAHRHFIMLLEGIYTMLAYVCCMDRKISFMCTYSKFFRVFMRGLSDCERISH